MSKTANKILKEEYRKLKNALKKILKPERKESMPQLILQPIRNKRY